MLWQRFPFMVPRASRDDENRAPVNILISTILLVLATVFVLLRVTARRMKKLWGPEDWFCIAALLVHLASGGLNYGQVANGLGRHVEFVPVDQQVVVLKCLLALECLYNVAMVLVKFSYCYMYLRLFPHLRIHVHVVAAFVSVWGLAFIFVILFQCTPMSKQWEPQLEGHCLDPRPVFVANAALNFLSDMALLCMPITQVMRLQMKTPVKLSICSIFLLGGFTSFSGLYRIKTLLEVDPTDATWTFEDSNIWTIIEMSCAVISVCLPTLRPILSKVSATFASSINSRGVTTDKSRARQTRTQTTHERLECDSTEYLPIYSPWSRTRGRAPSTSKDQEPIPAVQTADIRLSNLSLENSPGAGITQD